jgi:hypothetical protein
MWGENGMGRAIPPVSTAPAEGWTRGGINRKALIEAISVLSVGVVSTAEALRLIIYKDPYKLYDPIGPGVYLLALSVGLLIVGVCHLASNCRRPRMVEREAETSGEMRQLLGAIAVLLLYIVLINITGYLVATGVFFLLDMRVSGVKSWRTDVIVTLFLTAIFYSLFVKVCELPFPRGIFVG